MNTTKLNKMLDAYYKDFESNWKEEEYKWIEVQRFNDNFTLNCNPNIFLDVLHKSIEKSSNLVASNRYYPYKDLEVLVEQFPKDIQDALEILYNEKLDVYERVSKYSIKIDEIKDKEGKNNTAYAKDRRFISTLLFFKYPDKYTIYKYTENRKFSEEYSLGINIKQGTPDFIYLAKNLAEIVANHIENYRPDILGLYRKKLVNSKYYKDENLLLLAQNIIWYATKYEYTVDEEVPKKVIQLKHGDLKKSAYKPSIKKKGTKTDYIKEAVENKKTGLSGESFVMHFENERISPLNKTATWASKEEGDGLGYDILSYNDDGSKRYIEVKTTNGAENTMFYISATELEACKKYGDNYFLYRVYKEKGEWKISYYQGKEVEALCNCPSQYAVVAEGKTLE